MNSTHYNPDRLRELREQKALSQREVADVLSVHEQTVYRAEAGVNLSYEMLCSLAEFYGVEVTSLLYPRPVTVAA